MWVHNVDHAMLQDNSRQMGCVLVGSSKLSSIALKCNARQKLLYAIFFFSLLFKIVSTPRPSLHFKDRSITVHKFSLPASIKHIFLVMNEV